MKNARGKPVKAVFAVTIGAALGLAACSSDNTAPAGRAYDAPQAPQNAAVTDAKGLTEAKGLLRDATETARTMNAQPELKQLMQQAKGIFIVPNYAKGALGVGGAGGNGVLLARRGNGWSDPAFYDIGSVSIGAQAGGKVGNIAMLLMSDRALADFKSNNSFSLNADAGFTLADFAARAQASTKGADVVLWSDTDGAFAGVSLGVSNISWDAQENRAYYAKPQLTAADVLNGTVTTTQDDELQHVLQS
jgi:lipid-binding SYLF domain-containing protein